MNLGAPSSVFEGGLLGCSCTGYFGRVPRVPVFCTGVSGHLGTSLFLDFQPLTLDFQLLIPDRYFFSANRPSTIEYYCIVVTNARE
jgi:hypothetical protein